MLEDGVDNGLRFFGLCVLNDCSSLTIKILGLPLAIDL